MRRPRANRHLAAALLKTIKRLEEDPEVKPDDPAFIHVKSTLLQRLISVEVDTAETEAKIHLVEPSRKADPPEQCQAEVDTSAIA